MEIKAARGTYRVEFRNSFSDLEHELSLDKYHAILFDEKLPKLNLISNNFLSSIPSLGIEASEKSKSYLEVNRVLEWFSENSLNRNSMVLAIGGGAIQDVATFACSIFHRGINWTYVPTTLLSQSDSSIGGKCGINLQHNKNQIGVVYPPNKIFTVHEFLNYLPESEITSGIGEILKMSLTDEGQFWNQMKTYLTETDSDLKEIIKLSLYAKKLVVEIDEFEHDYRKVLNYGHTFGHAFESASSYQIPHGIAVLLGMKVVHNLGIKWGVSNPDFVLEVNEYIDKVLGSTNYLDLVSKDLVFEKIKSDKKVREGKITLVLLEELGKLKFISKFLDTKLESEIMDAISSI